MLWEPPRRCSREFGMKWRVMLELVGPDGIVGVYEVGGRAAAAEYAPQTMRGSRVVFASVPAEATSQTRQLRGVLHGLGATPATPVTVLSDGADGPRSLGEAASPGPTHHVLDWFHLAMRVQHVAQAAIELARRDGD